MPRVLKLFITTIITIFGFGLILSLFGIPIQLDGIVSREHYEKFHSGYITDVIAGHPMASNGWMREAMDDMEEMGVF